MDAQLARFDLTAHLYATMSMLRSIPDRSSAALARAALITPQAMGQQVAHLELLGLVERRPDPHHGRVRLTRLTSRGYEVLRQADAVVRAEEDRLLEALEPADRATLMETLGVIARRLGSGLVRSAQYEAAGGPPD